MEEIAINILTSWASEILVNFSTKGITIAKNKLVSIFKNTLSKDPSLTQRIIEANTIEEKEAIFTEILGIISVSAEDGGIEISSEEDRVLVESLTAIRLDHARGYVNIAGADIKSDTILTGGGINSTGKTNITNTNMSTENTRISIGKGAFIKISGNALIKQH